MKIKRRPFALQKEREVLCIAMSHFMLVHIMYPRCDFDRKKLRLSLRRERSDNKGILYASMTCNAAFNKLEYISDGRSFALGKNNVYNSKRQHFLSRKMSDL